MSTGCTLFNLNPYSFNILTSRAKVDGLHKGLPMAKGDILKAAGWRAPAKHSRGSIFDSEMHKSFSWTGPNYL